MPNPRAANIPRLGRIDGRLPTTHFLLQLSHLNAIRNPASSVRSSTTTVAWHSQAILPFRTLPRTPTAYVNGDGPAILGTQQPLLPPTVNQPAFTHK